MDLRHLLAPVLSAAGALVPAQQGQQPPADPDPAGAAARQEPRKTPAERIDELTDEKARLEREIEFVKSRVANYKGLLVGKFRDRELAVRSIDAGTSAAAPVVYAPAQRQARVMNDEERQTAADDVLMLVNGRQVKKAGIDQMVDYLKGFPSSGDDGSRMQRAMLETIRIESTMGAFPESTASAQQKIAAARQELRDGKPFGEVAQKYGGAPLQDDGKVRITRVCPFGLPLEMAAFATGEGQVTEPVQSYTGFALVQVDKVVKGANDDQTKNADLDQVEGRMLLIPFHPDPAELDAVRNRAVMGPIDIVVRDDTVMEMLPPLYRPLPAQKTDAEVQKDADVPKADPGRKG